MNKVDITKLTNHIMLFNNALNDVTDVIWKSEKYVKPVDRFIYTVFVKVKGILDSVHFHIYNLDQKPHYAITVGLALRTCMLDILNLYYVLDALEDDLEVESKGQ